MGVGFLKNNNDVTNPSTKKINDKTVTYGLPALRWRMAYRQYSDVWPTGGTVMYGLPAVQWCMAYRQYSDVWPTGTVVAGGLPAE